MQINESNEYAWRLFVVMLKNIAEEKKITHQDIADITGLHRSNVTRFFGLKYCPSVKVFIAISKAIKVNFFFEDQESKTELNLIFEKSMTQLGRRIENLPPENLN